MTSRLDRAVVLGLQGLVLGVPLLLGGNTPWAPKLFCPLVLALLAVTVTARWYRGTARGTPGVAWLAAFVALGLFTTLPLPPPVLGWLSPATARLYRAALPGWPNGGDWTVWRSLAYDPWAAWSELLRFSLGFGAFSVLVAYPWEKTSTGQPGATVVLERLFFTVFAGGLVFAGLGALEQVAPTLTPWGSEGEPPARLAGPFVDPDHFAAWLEMLLPAALAYALVVAKHVRVRLTDAVRTGRAVGVRARRAWASALLTNERRLWLPLVVAAAVMLLVAAHAATDSRGGRAALGSGLLFATFGFHAMQWSEQVQRLVRRSALALALGVLAITTAGFLFLARQATEEQAAGNELQTLEVDLGSRLAAADRGTAIVVDHPLFGTGLGSWLHAFRPYQAPPVEDGIWDHAHNDYLELTAETGFVGAALVLLFALAVGRAVRSAPDAPHGDGHDEARGSRRRRREANEPDFGERDWRTALRETGALRWGLAGGVVAILVHSFVDFSLRMPGNLVLLMTLLGLLVLLGRGAPAPARVAPVALLVLVALTAAIPVVDRIRGMVGLSTLSPDDAMAEADEVLAVDADAGRGVAVARWAVDRSPANRDAHRTLAEALGSGEEAEAALRRAIALDPWASELRDELALQLWRRGKRKEAAVEIEESMFRYPHLETHAYLSPESGIFPPSSAAQMLHELGEGETLSARLAQLEPEMADAIEHGLERALAANRGGDGRALITDDVITLLEARGRYAEAAEALRAEGEMRADESVLLERAARNYLKVGDLQSAEETLLAAIKRDPEQGALYRNLAVNVYARRGQFDTAETVLEAGGRNATDMTPVYRGITEVLTKREVAPSVEPPKAGDAPSAEGDDDGSPAATGSGD